MAFDYDQWKREWKLRNPEKAAAAYERAKAARRRKYAEDPEFRARRKEQSARDYQNSKVARAEYQKRWAERNHEKVLRMAGERYRRTDPRKRFAQRANRKVAMYGRPDDVLDWTTLPDGPWACTYCGVPCESWDHVAPLILGGANSAENLVPSCLPCNQRRVAHRPKPLVTSCRHGHAYDEANTYYCTDGGRVCRACGAERYRRRAKRAAEAAA
jgi:hypothetical protein